MQSTVGTKFQSRRTVFQDARTGREVWKMTSWDDAHCLASYMYYQAFSGDERYLVFASDRSGRLEFYRLEIASGETVQMTARPPAPQDGPLTFAWLHNVHPNGRELFFTDDEVFWAVDIQTLEAHVAASRGRNPWRKVHGGPSLTGDGRRLVCAYQHENGHHGIAVAELNPNGGEAVLQEVWRREDSEEIIYHIISATAPQVLATFAPVPDRQNDPNESRAHRARAWKLDVRGCAEPLLVVPPGFRATHEYWGPDGRLYFHKKSVPNWTPNWIGSINAEGGDFQEHFGSDTRKLGHSAISRDGKWTVSDVQDPKGNELWLIDRATGQGEVLCWPDSTVTTHPHFSHVHPSFSPSGRYIVFTSDKGGKPAVYLMPLDPPLSQRR